ncbi:hypothetical protein A4R44_09329 [Amycolatopsis sp. M39]|nr:hypothetical protein A4R44_09329 [Amycolatopsis sp. M39]
MQSGGGEARGVRRARHERRSDALRSGSSRPPHRHHPVLSAPVPGAGLDVAAVTDPGPAWAADRARHRGTSGAAREPKGTPGPRGADRDPEDRAGRTSPPGRRDHSGDPEGGGRRRPQGSGTPRKPIRGSAATGTGDAMSLPSFRQASARLECPQTARGTCQHWGAAASRARPDEPDASLRGRRGGVFGHRKRSGRRGSPGVEKGLRSLGRWIGMVQWSASWNEISGLSNANRFVRDDGSDGCRGVRIGGGAGAPDGQEAGALIAEPLQESTAWGHTSRWSRGCPRVDRLFQRGPVDAREARSAMTAWWGLVGLAGLPGIFGLLRARASTRKDPLARYPVARESAVPNVDAAHTPLMTPRVTPDMLHDDGGPQLPGREVAGEPARAAVPRARAGDRRNPVPTASTPRPVEAVAGIRPEAPPSAGRLRRPGAPKEPAGGGSALRGSPSGRCVAFPQSQAAERASGSAGPQVADTPPPSAAPKSDPALIPTQPFAARSQLADDDPGRAGTLTGDLPQAAAQPPEEPPRPADQPGTPSSPSDQERHLRFLEVKPRS